MMMKDKEAAIAILTNQWEEAHKKAQKYLTLYFAKKPAEATVLDWDKFMVDGLPGLAQAVKEAEIDKAADVLANIAEDNAKAKVRVSSTDSTPSQDQLDSIQGLWELLKTPTARRQRPDTIAEADRLILNLKHDAGQKPDKWSVKDTPNGGRIHTKVPTP